MTNMLANSLRGLGMPCIAAVLACSQHTPSQPTFRVVARGIEISPCAVDHDWLYAQAGIGAVVRVSRHSGKIEKLAAADGLASVVAADGSLFFLDRGGVHVWKDGSATDIRSFGSGHASSTLVHFHDMVCWGGAAPQDENGEAAWPIECAPTTGTRTATTWAWEHASGSPSLAESAMYDVTAEHLYAAFPRDATHCEIADATQPNAFGQATEILPIPSACSGMFVATTDGAIMREDVDTFLKVDPGAHEIATPHPSGSPLAIENQVYMRAEDGPVRLDLRTGSASLLAHVALGSAAPAMCGDARAIYVGESDGSVVEVPINSGQGG